MDVSDWLRGLGLESYASLFAANDIDTSTLRLLTAEDLKEIGIQSVGHRRRILAAAAELEEKPPPLESPAPSSAPASERREVTVLFADIAGFTELSSTSDAEDMHRLLAQFFERADAIIADLGGRVDKHIGDCVMGVFGAPLAHADDMERAARAADRIHKAMPAISSRAPLRAHVGLATGEVVASATGSSRFHEYTVTGETVNLASRLCATAAPGETILSDAIARSLSAGIAVERLGARALKGFPGETMIWRLADIGEAGEARRPIFGRKAELTQCLAALETVSDLRRGSVVVLRGEPGIGKSRLAEEVGAKAREAGWQVEVARVPEFAAGTSSDVHSALGRELFAALLAFQPEARRSLAAIADRYAIPAELRLAIEDLAGLDSSPDDRRRLSAMTDAARTTARAEALVALAAALATHSPLLLTVEDLHWANEATLSGLELLIQRASSDLPLLMLMTTRPDGDPTRRSKFLPGTRGLTIDIGPLGPADARAHAASILATAETQVDRCVARAEGNPLFLEQLARHAAAGGVDRALPSSIKSTVLARIDRVEASEKQMLQAASVLGDAFSIEALRFVAGKPGYNPAPLIESRLVLRAGDSCRFAHALIREGVYGSLLHSARDELHRRAADWHRDRDLALCAEHLARAKDRSAFGVYLEAAQKLLGEYRTELALDVVCRAEAIAETDAERLAALLAKGDDLLELGRGGEAFTAYEGALGAASNAVERATAQLGKASALRALDRQPEAMPLLEEAELPLRQAQRIDLLARLEHLRGNLLFALGQRAACEAAHAKALRHAEDAGAIELKARALGGLADAAYASGLYVTSERRLKECIDLARQHGLGRVEIANLPMLAATRCFVGEGLGAADSAIEAASAARQPRAELIGHHIAMVTGNWSGQPERVAPHFERAQAIVSQLGAKRFEPENLVFMADALRQLGKEAEAQTCVDRALAIIEAGKFVYFAAIVQGCRALVYHSDRQVREDALRAGEALLGGGGIAHDPLFYAYFGIEACLGAEDHDGVERLARLLDTAFAEEPSPLTRLLSERGRLLVEASKAGAISPELARRLRQCRQSALDMHYAYFAQRIDALTGVA